MQTKFAELENQTVSISSVEAELNDFSNGFAALQTTRVVLADCGGLRE